MLKTSDTEKNLKSQRKKDTLCRGTKIRIIPDFSSEKSKPEDSSATSLKTDRKKCEPRILYPNIFQKLT